MSTRELNVDDRFPQENIRPYNCVKIHKTTATVAVAAPNPPSNDHTFRVTKVEMSCSGYLDTHTILIDDADILRMFVMKDVAVVIDMSPFSTIPKFALEPAGPMPDNYGERDAEEDLQMVEDAFKTCRLVWGQGARIAKLRKHMAKTKQEAELAALASNAKRPEDRPTQPENLWPNRTRPANARRPAGQPSSTPTTTPPVRIGDDAHLQPDSVEYRSDAAEHAMFSEAPSGRVHQMRNEIEAIQAEKGEQSAWLAETRSEGNAFQNGNGYGLPMTNYEEDQDDGADFVLSSPSPKKSVVETTTLGARAKVKPGHLKMMIWPKAIITGGTAGHRLRPLMEEMGQILTTEDERQGYMDLVWTRRRATAGDAAAQQAVIDDLENFVRGHGIVDLHNLWARWMEPRLKTVMPMYKPVGTGKMDAAERRKMFERRKRT